MKKGFLFHLNGTDVLVESLGVNSMAYRGAFLFRTQNGGFIAFYSYQVSLIGKV